MNSPPDDADKIEDLVRVVESWSDPTAREVMRELTRAIMNLHQAGLSALLEAITQSGATGQAILESCRQHPLVNNLLLLHNLHPHDLQQRVGEVLAQLAPILRQHGIREIVPRAARGVVHLRIHGENGDVKLALKNLIEGSIREAAPDVDAVVFDEAAPRPATIPLPVLADSGRRPR